MEKVLDAIQKTRARWNEDNRQKQAQEWEHIKEVWRRFRQRTVRFKVFKTCITCIPATTLLLWGAYELHKTTHIPWFIIYIGPKIKYLLLFILDHIH
jgi:hypothetical protein